MIEVEACMHLMLIPKGLALVFIKMFIKIYTIRCKF